MRNQAGSGQFETVQIQLLGRFQVSIGERSIAADRWKLRKAQNLVKLLALAPFHHRLHREQLIEQLWPDSDPEQATTNFHQALYVARRTLDPTNTLAQHYLQFQGEILCLCPDLPLWIDVEAFEDAAARSRASSDPEPYHAALEIYTGDLLPEDAYEHWVIERRKTLQQEYQNLRIGLARVYEVRQQYDPAIENLKRVLAGDPIHEEAHFGLMRLYAQVGHRQLALRQYQALQENLSRELAAEPDPIITRFYQELLSGRYSPAGVETQPVHSSVQPPAPEPEAPQHNLPIAVTRFFGWEPELDELHRLLHPAESAKDGRLITLTGVGGSGKTRMAVEAAFQLVDQYPEGIWLVELAGLTDPQMVPQSLASILRVRELPGKPLVESLVAFLRNRQVLLVLDNCEHLVEPCARLAEELLRACPRLHILATSREALRIPGERLFPVPALTFPDPQQASPLEGLVTFEAVQLFVDRARAASPNFNLTGSNATFVAQICARLDGLPLALELAAARAKVLAVEQIAVRLDDRFRLLTMGSRTGPTRQQNLQATLDWSFQLLTSDEQTLFHRLAIFSGGFDLEAAEAISLEGDASSPSDVLDLLTSLVDKSLVTIDQSEAQRRTGGPNRYRLLETVQAYARQRLEESGEMPAIGRRHLAYYLELAEWAEPKLKSAAQVEWLGRLEREYDNLRAALARCIEQEEADLGLRLTGALGYFWNLRSLYNERAHWLAKALALKGGSAIARARTLAVVDDLSFQTDGVDQTMTRIEEGLRLARQMGDDYLVALHLVHYGKVQSQWNKDNPQTIERLLEGLAIARTMGDPWLIARTLIVLGDCEGNLGFGGSPGKYEISMTHLKEGLIYARTVGDRALISEGLLNLGYIAACLNDFSLAKTSLEECRELYQAIHFQWGIAYVHLSLGFMALRQGDYAASYGYLLRRVEIERELDGHYGFVHSLNALGYVAHVMGDDRQAEAHFEESLADSRAFDYSWGSAVQLNSLGFLALSQGNQDKAQVCFLESLELYQDLNDSHLLASNLYGLARIAFQQGQPAKAARWLGAIGPTFGYIENFMNFGITHWVHSETYVRDVAAVREQCGETDFSKAWEAGTALGLTGAIQNVLADKSPD